MATTSSALDFVNGDTKPTAPSAGSLALYPRSGTWYSEDSAGVESPIVSGVSSVTNSDGTLTISPTTGAVVASLASTVPLAHTFSGAITLGKSIAGPYPFYSLVANGADPTGVASSTAAWNTVVAAINAAPRGGSMYLDAGVYLVDFSTATQFTGSNWSIVGADRGCAAIVPSAATNTTSNLLTLPNQAMVTIRDVSFIATTVRTAGAMISTNGCDDVIIDRFQMSGHFNGISVDGSSIKVKCQDGVFTTSSGSPNADIVINNGSAGDTYIGPYIISSHTGANRPIGIQVIASGHYEVNMCNVTGCSSGMTVIPGAAAVVAFGFINSTLFDSCTVNGCVLDATAAGTIKQLFFNNSWFCGTITGAGQAGFLSKGVAGTINGIQFTQCRAILNQTHGFQHGYGTGFEWIGCNAKNNSQATNNTSDGLNVAAAVSGWGVIGGRYGGSDSSDSTPTPGQKNGISITAGAGTDIRIIGADLRGNASGALLQSATGARITLQGNIGMVVAPPGSAPGQLYSTTAITKCTAPSIFFPANGSRAGTKVRISITVTCVATVNTAPGFVPALRFGTADSSADTPIIATPAYSSAGTAALGAARYVWEITILSATTAQGSLQVFNLNNAASGVMTAIQTWGAISTTALTIPTTANDNFLGVYFTSTVANVDTVRDVSYEVWQ